MPRKAFLRGNLKAEQEVGWGALCLGPRFFVSIWEALLLRYLLLPTHFIDYTRSVFHFVSQYCMLLLFLFATLVVRYCKMEGDLFTSRKL